MSCLIFDLPDLMLDLSSMIFDLSGSTEMSPVVTMSRLEHAPSERIKNVGYVMDHVEVQ